MRHALVALTAAALLAGCRERPATHLAWQVEDLTRVAPVALADAAGPSPVAAVETFLGGEEVRDLERLDAFHLRNVPRLAASRVRALRQLPGTRAVWRLSLGAQPWLEMRPLQAEGDCRPDLEVTVATGGEAAVTVWTGRAAARALPAPALEVVDLGPWAGREILLGLQAAAAERSCAALWGSPAVISRRPAPAPARTARPNVLLIGADTLRADALGAWGRSPSLTPALDALAAESDVFLDAHSSFNVTNPSFVSLMTGRWGRSHGVYDLQSPLPDAATTLAELFSGAGYATWAVLSVQHLGHHASGLGQGFEAVDAARGHKAAEQAVGDLLARLEGRDERPFFAWLHLFDPHTPHTPPSPYAEGRRPERPFGFAPVSAWTALREPGPVAFREPVLAAARDLYDGEVAYLDRAIDRLLGAFADRGLLDDTVVAFVADHGENLEDHGIRYRHAGLWDTTLHVPLMIRWPRGEGRRVRGLVQNVDLFPTLLAAAGIDPPPSDGIDLRPVAAGRHPGRRAAFAEHSGAAGASVRTDRWRYTEITGHAQQVPAGPALYDLERDPDESENLAGRGLAAEAELARLLARWREAAQAPAAATRSLTAEEEAELRALGYL